MPGPAQCRARLFAPGIQQLGPPLGRFAALRPFKKTLGKSDNWNMDSGPGSLPRLLESILNSFIDLIGCDAGSIYALRPIPEGERVLAFEEMITRSIKLREVPEHLKNLRFKVDDSTLVGRTATHRKSHRISFTQKEGKTSPQVDRILNYSTQSILSAPLVTPRGDLVGVVQLLN